MRISNRFIEYFSADQELSNTSRQVDNALYSFVSPTPTIEPRTVIYSLDLAKDLELNEAFCESDAFAKLFSGNAVTAEMRPYASRYGGHQFGHWAGQLGDGRAINLGELALSSGRFQSLQLKGAGPTPYSRGADGRAVLRSSVREFLCSEAMHHLGVPTTRALSLVTTGDEVMRDMFYDGHPALEPGAVVCRVAPNFIRFGHFQLCAIKGEVALLRGLIEYTIDTGFPEYRELLKDKALPREAVYISWFRRVCELTADMVVDWMRVGYVHGVMNTDNMSIMGLTIDYGPYGWIDDYDPDWTPNTTDFQNRRYRFGQQARIAQWNLYQLANALVPVIENTEVLEAALARFAVDYQTKENAMMAQKLGFEQFEGQCDAELISGLELLLTLHRVDMTLFYRSLASFAWQSAESSLMECIHEALYDPEAISDEFTQALQEWSQAYRVAMAAANIDDTQRRQRMNAVNPKYVLRNYMAQQAIDLAHAGDYSLVHTLYALLQRPYDEQPENAHFAAKRPKWAEDKAGCSTLSCSS
jgi:uncharacterized protein YdiU (UPF0061 family)